MSEKRSYEAKVAWASCELTAKQRISAKEFTDAVDIVNEVENESLLIDLDYATLISVHNEKSEAQDYEVLVLTDKNGMSYKTSSESFITKFRDLYDEIVIELNEGEEWELKCYSLPSKNRAGARFLTCTIV